MGEERGNQEGSNNMLDKTWTLEELRKGASNWSMSTDAGMLQYLQDYSQKMISRTHELQQQLNSVLHETKLTSVRVNSAFNDFIMLANTQFVENRVYDEDVTQEDEEDKEANTKKEKTKEEREAELIPKISEAMKLGLGVIDSAFEKLDINDGNSDSEEEEPGFKAETILEPKDPYIHRPLPYLIGSQSFLQDDDVGLIDYMSDEEQAVEEEESESETESEGDSPAETTTKTEKKKLNASDSEEEYSDGGSDLFGGDSSTSDFEAPVKKKHQSSEEESEDEDNQQQQGGTARDFTSELAAKIGAAPVAPPENKPTDKDHHHTKKKKDKTKKQSQPPDDAGDDLFGPPKQSVDEIDDDDSPFGHGGGLFSSSKNGGGLFDDEDDLFNEITAPSTTKHKRAAAPAQQSQDSAEEEEAVPKPVTKSGKKVPTGGVSIFGDDTDDLFSMPSDTSTSGTKKQPSTSKPTSSQPPKKIQPSGGGGLFDGSDEEDLFDAVTKHKPSAAKPAPKQSTKSALFDDDDEGDLFADQPVTKDTKQEVVHQQKPASKKPDHKLPPGAVSMFGAADNPLVAALKAKQRPPQSDSEEDDEDDDKVSTQSVSSKSSSTNQLTVKKEKSPSLSSNSLFAEEQDDLFSSNASKVSTTVKDTKQIKTSHTKPAGIFGESDDDNEEDLFSIGSKPSTKSTDKSKAHTLLFDEDEEDIFSTSKPSPQSQKKKPVGGVSLFGGADLFGSSPPAVGSKQEARPPQQEQSQAQVDKSESTSPAKSNRLSLFDGNDEDDADGDIFATEPPKAKHAAKSKESPTKSKTSGKGLFQDEDLLFGTKEDDPTVDLFGKSSPLKSKPEVSEKEAPPVQPIEVTQPRSDPALPTSGMRVGGATEGSSSTGMRVGGATEGSSTTDLFGDEEEEDLFGDSKEPVEKKQQEEPESVKPKKLAGAVSMFGGMDPTALLKKKTSSPRGPPISQKPKPEISHKPQEQSRQGVDDPLFVSSVDTSDGKPALAKRPTPASKSQTAVNKIQSGLAINPANLLPGAAPPRPDTEPKAVGFDEPVRTHTLTSVGKDRPKIQQNRRPPTRHSRRSRANQSGPEFTDSVDRSTVDYASRSTIENHVGHLGDHSQSSVRENTAINRSSALSNHSSNLQQNSSVINNNTIKHSPREQKIGTKQDIFSDFSSSSTNHVTTSQNDDVEDLFSSGKTESKSSSTTNTNKPAPPVTKVQQNKTKDLFDSDDGGEEDIFSQLKSKTFTEDEMNGVTDDLFDVLTKPRSGTGDSKATSGTGSKVNLFGTSQSSKASIPSGGQQNEITVTSTQNVVHITTDNTEASDSSAKTVNATEKVQSWLETNEPVVKPSSKSIFEDGDDDIFAANSNKTNKPNATLTSVVKNETLNDRRVENRTKSSVKATKSHDDDDDLFSSSKTTTVKKTVTTVKKSSSMLNDDTDDIFSNASLTSNKKKSAASAVRSPLDDDDDLFSSSNKTVAKKTKAAPLMDDDIFADSSLNRKTKQPPRKPLDDDIFGGVKPKSKPGFTMPDIDDIFAGSRMSVKPIAPPTTDKSDELTGTADTIKPDAGPTDIFDDASNEDPRKNIDGGADGDIFADVPSGQTADNNDDIFGDQSVKPKTSKAKKKHVTKDEDIFKDDTDIFADIPSSKPKEKKSKKKPLFKDDPDDIFADSSSPATKSTKKTTKTTTKKTRTKTTPNLDDSPNIFDDPLNALK